MQNSIRTAGIIAAFVAAIFVPRVAVADEDHQIRAHLIGYNEVPSINTDANATFTIKIARDRKSFDWTLSYAFPPMTNGLPTSITQAHIHFGQPGVAGAIVIWLCFNPPITPPAAAGNVQTCGTDLTHSISATATSANVVGVAAQGITAGDFEAILEAIEAGLAYANVHTSAHAGGEIRGPLRHHD